MTFFDRIFSRKKKELEYTEKDWLKELDWANVYHDSIRGKLYLEQLSLNVGRWAGNYAFFYVLNRIMHDYKPERIIEFGLGESSKFVSSCIDGINYNCEHVIVEQSDVWNKQFQSNFNLSKKSKTVICPLEVKKIKDYNVNTYSNLLEKITPTADLYIIDGPFGSERYSRYDICFLIEKINADQEFIIILDDCQRQGEKDTFMDIIEILENKKIKFHTASYTGVKTVNIIATTKYKYTQSL